MQTGSTRFVITNLFSKVYFYFFKRAVYRKIMQANEEKALTGYKYMVLKSGGWPVLVKKKDMKKHLARRRFKKGISIHQLEKAALYITP